MTMTETDLDHHWFPHVQASVHVQERFCDMHKILIQKFDDLSEVSNVHVVPITCGSNMYVSGFIKYSHKINMYCDFICWIGK